MTDISNNNINDEVVKKKKIKNKEKRFCKERKNILDKIINVVGTRFLSHEFDQDKEKHNKILELDNDIKKYFNVSNWGAYKPTITIGKRPISIVKSVIKDMNVEMNSRTYIVRKDDKSTTETEYNIVYTK